VMQPTAVPIRLAVIGCGHWGPNLVRNFVDLPGVQVVAIADVRAQRLDYMRGIYPSLTTAEDYSDLFSLDLDAAAIATPPASHFSVARDCLLHNLAVLVEKPMTLSSTDAEELVALADQRCLTLMAGHTCEYNPAVRLLRDMIRQGELGDVFHIETVRTNLGLFQPGLDVVWDLAPHDLSMLLFLLGDEPTSVGTCGGCHVVDGYHETAYLNMTFPGDITAHVHVSWLDPKKERRMTIVGSRKMATYDELAPTQKIRIYDKGVELPPLSGAHAEFRPAYRYGKVEFPKVAHVEPLRLECEDFLRAVSTGAKPQSTGRSGLRVVRALEAATRSLLNGGGREPVALREQLVDLPAVVGAD